MRRLLAAVLCLLPVMALAADNRGNQGTAPADLVPRAIMDKLYDRQDGTQNSDTRFFGNPNGVQNVEREWRLHYAKGSYMQAKVVNWYGYLDLIGGSVLGWNFRVDGDDVLEFRRRAIDTGSAASDYTGIFSGAIEAPFYIIDTGGGIPTSADDMTIRVGMSGGSPQSATSAYPFRWVWRPPKSNVGGYTVNYGFDDVQYWWTGAAPTDTRNFMERILVKNDANTVNVRKRTHAQIRNDDAGAALLTSINHVWELNQTKAGQDIRQWQIGDVTQWEIDSDGNLVGYGNNDLHVPDVMYAEAIEVAGNVAFTKAALLSCGSGSDPEPLAGALKTNGFGSVECGATGDVTAVGPGCEEGDCWQGGTATAGAYMRVWEGENAVDGHSWTEKISDCYNPGTTIEVEVPCESGDYVVRQGDNTWTGTQTFDDIVLPTDSIDSAEIADDAVGASEISTGAVVADGINDAVCLSLGSLIGAPLPQAGTNYCFLQSSSNTTPCGSATELAWDVVVPQGEIKIHHLYVEASVAPDNGGGTQNWIFSLRDDGAETGLGCTLSEAATSCTDTGSVTIASGSKLNWRVIPQGIPAASSLGSITFCYGQ